MTASEYMRARLSPEDYRRWKAAQARQVRKP